MDAESSRREGTRWVLLATASFVPLLVKAISYARLGSYVPLLVFLFFGILVSSASRIGPRAGRIAMGTWALALVLWGLARIGLMGLFKLAPIDDAHIEGQFTAWFVLLSVGSIILGIYLLRGRGRPR